MREQTSAKRLWAGCWVSGVLGSPKSRWHGGWLLAMARLRGHLEVPTREGGRALSPATPDSSSTDQLPCARQLAPDSQAEQMPGRCLET